MGEGVLFRHLREKAALFLRERFAGVSRQGCEPFREISTDLSTIANDDADKGVLDHYIFSSFSLLN